MRLTQTAAVPAVKPRLMRIAEWSFLAMAALFVCLSAAVAQTTGTNAVSLIQDNVTNARDTLVPLAIGAAVLFVSIAAGKKFWKRIFG